MSQVDSSTLERVRMVPLTTRTFSVYHRGIIGHPGLHSFVTTPYYLLGSGELIDNLTLLYRNLLWTERLESFHLPMSLSTNFTTNFLIFRHKECVDKHLILSKDDVIVTYTETLKVLIQE